MRAIKILHLYPDRMNIYGDFGNIIALQKRMEWRGIEHSYHTVTIGDEIKGDYDIVFMGGGQDSGQNLVADDLQTKSKALHAFAENNTPMLMVCGAYQLFGKYFITLEGNRLPGIGIFNVITKAGDQRMIGNISIESDTFGKLIGFENHSGETTLLDDSTPLGKVLKGYGNSTKADTEGVLMNNAIGTYLHGSFLPKNPKVTDFLIEKAIQKIDSKYVLKELDDSIERQARDNIIKNIV